MPTENKVFITPEGEHDYNKQYEQYSIVKHTQENNINVYLAIKPVPPFIAITDKNYWKRLNSDTNKADASLTYDIGSRALSTLTNDELISLETGTIVYQTEGLYKNAFILTYKDSANKYVIFTQVKNYSIDIITFSRNKTTSPWNYNYSQLGFNSLALKPEKVQLDYTQNPFIPYDKVCYFGTITSSCTFLLEEVSTDGLEHIYTWIFTTGSTAPTINWPAEITMWNGGEIPEIKDNKYYEVSVMNGVGTVISADIPQTEVKP